ncbi:hypothetical protein [Agarivorans sp. QJM3NY_33]
MLATKPTILLGELDNERDSPHPPCRNAVLDLQGRDRLSRGALFF